MTKIEEVATAISRSFHEEGFIEGISDPAEWGEFLKAARAAIEAMRPLSEPMVDAYCSNADAKRPMEDVVKERWNAMIDAALAEQSS